MEMENNFTKCITVYVHACEYTRKYKQKLMQNDETIYLVWLFLEAVAELLLSFSLVLDLFLLVVFPLAAVYLSVVFCQLSFHHLHLLQRLLLLLRLRQLDRSNHFVEAQATRNKKQEKYAPQNHCKKKKMHKKSTTLSISTVYLH